jgi:hypothetical protein
MRLKAWTFRTYLTLLAKDEKCDTVMALVPPETATLMANPPLAGSWMDFSHILNIVKAVEKVGGLAAVRELARKGNEQARKPYMGIVETVLRLFGTSPATLFKRMNSLVSSFLQGVDFAYTPINEQSGFMEVTYAAEFEIPSCAYMTLVPTFETLLGACGARGVVGAPERLSATSARLRIQW